MRYGVCKPLEQSVGVHPRGHAEYADVAELGIGSGMEACCAEAALAWIRKERTASFLPAASQCAPFVLRCALLSRHLEPVSAPESLMLLWTLPLTRRMSAVRARQPASERLNRDLGDSCGCDVDRSHRSWKWTAWHRRKGACRRIDCVSRDVVRAKIPDVNELPCQVEYDRYGVTPATIVFDDSGVRVPVVASIA